ncbi:MAG: hypothetical protein KF764_00010 [Labilithrix sp.]|nr:hypothetical protein [Labilithrix sp.]
MRFGVGLLGVSALVALAPALACSDEPGVDAPAALDDGGPAEAAAPEPDGGAGVEARIVVRTSTPASSVSPGGPAPATWAAYRKDSGAWDTLPATAAATYSFTTTSSRWAVALACADDRTSIVAVYERPASVASLDVVLEEQCGAPPGDAYVLDGTLAHVPASTEWLDFGYALGARGAVIIPAGDSAPYEIVNVVGGTWNLAFGLREQAGTPLTKIALVRRRALAADTTLDLDLDAVGLVPGTKKLTVSGLDPADETLAAPVAYTMGDDREGIDVGQQDVPTAATTELSYATVPAAAQEAPDRYRAAIVASGQRGSTSRGVLAVFHEAVDLTFALPAPMAAPVVSVAAATPYLRVATKLPTREAAATYEVLASVRLSQRFRRAWSVSVDASLAPGGELEVTLPDLAAVPGFDVSWALPPDRERAVTATTRDKPTSLGDGASERFSAHTTTLEP